MKRFLIIILLLCLMACGKTEYQEGTFEELTYTNTYFSFCITFPETYEVYTDEQMSKVLGTSLKELQQQSANETLYEFMVSNEIQTPLFQFYVENYKFTTMATYDDFIHQVVQQFTNQDEIEYAVGAVVDVDIHGVQMKKIPLHANAGYFVLNQDIYMLRKGSYVGTMMITYLDSQEQEVEEIMQTMKLYE